MRYLLAIALAAVAAVACGCQVETSGGGIGFDAGTDEIEYFDPGPEFRLAREAAALKAERQAAQDAESAPKDVREPEQHEMTFEGR
jgi:hypothetical protein